MEEKEIKKDEWCEGLPEQIEEQIKKIKTEGIKNTNIDYLFRLVDIHKDLSNETYWKEKINMYRENYNDSYGRRRRDSRGRYMEGGYSEGGYSEGGYGRRGVAGSGRGRYRGEEMMDEMYMNYGEYSEGRDNYGADKETLKSLEKMLHSVKKFMKHLKNEAQSQEEVELIKETAEEISEM